MMMIVLPNGTIVQSVNSNEFMESSREEASILDTLRAVDSTEVAYLRFLTEGLEKVEALKRTVEE